MHSETVDQFSSVDILVNCAAIIGPIGLVSQIEAEEWERKISVNLTGTFLRCQAALGPMMAQKICLFQREGEAMIAQAMG